MSNDHHKSSAGGVATNPEGSSTSELRGWKMFDWSISAFDTVVITALFGPYLLELTKETDGVTLLGWQIAPASFFPLVISVAAFAQVILLPLLGTVADHVSNKKRLMLGLVYSAAAATMGLVVVTGNNVIVGAALFLVASTAYSAATVVNNSYLPEIVSPALRDRVSSSGYAYGYMGGGLYLAASFLLITFMEDTGLAVRLSLAGAGLWCAVFIRLFTHRDMRDRTSTTVKPVSVNWVRFSFGTTLATARELWQQFPIAFRYLAAYVLFYDGIQTVIAVATTFAADELNAETQDLLLLVLMIQFVAVPGAIMFGRLAERWGAKRALCLNLLVWVGLVVYAYAQLDSMVKFWVMGVVLAMVLGGSRAIARSLFAQLIPKQKEAEYFGFYEIAAGGTSWIGPAVFAAVNQITGSQRQAILSLVFFLVGGVLVLFTVDVRRGMVDAGNDPASVTI